MQKLFTAGLIALALSGCCNSEWAPPPSDVIPFQPAPPAYPNPMKVQLTDPQCVWEAVTDVVNDYFKIEHEEPVRQIDGTLTEGRIDTFPQVSPTLLEPWRRDTAGEYERVENTLQTMRRRAVVRVLPGEGGNWIDVAVFKELEDLPRPEHASAGGATFRYDNTLNRVVNPSAGDEATKGWIPQGRDPVLEQRMLGHILARCNEMKVTPLR
jgi:hypothetical protein